MSTQESKIRCEVEEAKLQLAREIIEGHGFFATVVAGVLVVTEKALHDDQVRADMGVNNVTVIPKR